MLHAVVKNEMIDRELCIERLVSFSSTYGPSLLSSGGAPEASVGQRYARHANSSHHVRGPRTATLLLTRGRTILV